MPTGWPASYPYLEEIGILHSEISNCHSPSIISNIQQSLVSQRLDLRRWPCPRGIILFQPHLLSRLPSSKFSWKPRYYRSGWSRVCITLHDKRVWALGFVRSRGIGNTHRPSRRQKIYHHTYQWTSTETPGWSGAEHVEMGEWLLSRWPGEDFYQVGWFQAYLSREASRWCRTVGFEGDSEIWDSYSKV